MAIIAWNSKFPEPIEAKKERFRAMREEQCFPIINRGALWYETLTESQKQELKVWYIAWLDVTITFKYPELPDFLKE